MQQKLGRNTVVLLGVGHTNAHVLRMWKMKRPKNAQLICVSNFPVVTYSGMLPGVIAGQYPRSAMEIDLIRLAQSAGARVVIGKVTGLDANQQKLLFADRPALTYDCLSIGIGSRPSFRGVEVADASPLIAVKPMQTFLKRFTDRLRQLNKPHPKIVIVGGGVGSIEIAFCLFERFFGKPRFDDSDFPRGLQPEISLITGSSRVGEGLLASTIASIQDAFDFRDVQIRTNARVKKIETDAIVTEDGNSIAADIVIWATSAVGVPLLGDLGQELDQRGFLQTKSTLELTQAPGVFAVGDSGTIVGSQSPKAGVYAVRQGPILFKNIFRKLENRPLIDYEPQTGFLKLINFGNDKALAEYWGRTFNGKWAWRLKDRIDVKFMRMYQDYQPMKMVPQADDNEAMKCLGCGGKIGGQILSSALSELQINEHPDVKIGLANPDDAAVVGTRNNEVTVTTDFFAAPFDDPYLVGRVAALNSASDCFVMGAQPNAALAIVQVPLGHPRAQLQVMRELMAGAVEEFNAMDVSIVGGHSIEGPRTTIGFTVLGYQVADPMTKGGLKLGDCLVLTKPLGTGILLAAWMQCKMKAECYQPLIDSMLQSNQIALDLVKEFPVTALTDVTGFGLAGHLVELMTASKVDVRLEVDAIELLPGVRELVESGIQSTLAPDNRSMLGRIDTVRLDAESPALAPLFDPQTGGGLLFSIAEEHLDSVCTFLRQQGYRQTAVIGKVTQKNDVPSLSIVDEI